MNTVLKNHNLHLRKMTTTDVDEVLGVEQQAAYGYPWTHQNFQDCLQVGYTCLIWQLGGMIPPAALSGSVVGSVPAREEAYKIIGHGIMSIGAGECQILNLCTHPQWQGQGLGKRMLTRLLNLGRQQQADSAFLEVNATNALALRLYHSMGFNEIGRRRGYYLHAKGRMDALVLAKSLQFQ